MKWRGRRRRDADLERELRSDLDLEEEEQQERGLSSEEARYAALRAFGNPTLIHEQTHETWAWAPVERFLQDLRIAWRVLWKSPIFAITAIVTLALGIGATTAIFSAMNAVLLRRMPVADPQQIVYLTIPNGQPYGASNTGDSDSSFSLPVFESLRREHSAFSEVMAFAPLSIDKVDVRVASHEPEQAAGEMVSGNFFSGLGVSVAHGRALSPDDETQHAAVAVISYPWWTRRFSRDPAVLGHTLFIKGIPFTVVGVAAQGFSGAEPGNITDFWIPLQRRTELTPWGESDVSLYGTPDWWCLRLIARLVPGVTPQQAVAEVTPVFRATAFADLKSPVSEQMKLKLVLNAARGLGGVGDFDPQPIRILMALVALVLVIACSNVAMLITARNASRQHDFSLRMALGASRRSVFRQLFTESTLVAGSGALLGWLLALFATRSLAAWMRIETGLEPDRLVLLFTTVVSLLAALVFSLAPLRMIAHVPVTGKLRTSSGTSSRQGRAGFIVLVAQVALCFTLLIAAGLLVRTLLNYERTDLGMRMKGLLVFGVTPQQAATGAERYAFYGNLLDRMRGIPGVESATLMNERLGSGWSENDEPTVDGVTHSFEEIPLRANLVGPGYLHTLGIPIVAGRDIQDSDTANSPRVVLVNETFVRKLLPNTNPLGHRLGRIDDPKHEPFTIVGVARDSKYRSVDENPRAMAYFPYTQMGFAPATMQVELRIGGNSLATLPSVERAVHAIDANLPLEKPMTQADVFADSYADQRLFARLSLFFGLLAALLVAVGLYGVLSFRVSRRTTEIGVRMTLGAPRGQILAMIVRQSLRVTAFGIAVGVPLALLTTHFMQSMLYRLESTDKLTFCAALLGVTVVGLAAGVIPAYRAACIDPMQALRSE
jgi:predicted permease